MLERAERNALLVHGVGMTSARSAYQRGKSAHPERGEQARKYAAMRTRDQSARKQGERTTNDPTRTQGEVGDVSKNEQMNDKNDPERGVKRQTTCVEWEFGLCWVHGIKEST